MKPATPHTRSRRDFQRLSTTGSLALAASGQLAHTKSKLDTVETETAWHPIGV